MLLFGNGGCFLKREVFGSWKAHLLREEKFEKRDELRSSDVYHAPKFEGDFNGFLKQANLLEIFKEVGYAELEKKPLWDLVGHGKAYVDCGKIRVKGCDHVEDHENGKVFGEFYKRNCRRKQCPVCFEGWAIVEAERSLIRFASFVSGNRDVDRLLLRLKKEMLDDPKPKQFFHRKLVLELEKMATARGYRPIHVVLSPPKKLHDEFRTFEGYRKMRKKAYKIAKESGLYGGSMIIHPYRLRCSNCHSAIPDYQRKCPRCGQIKFEWYFSPHFHFVGYGWIKGEKVKEGYSRHGWVVKNLKVRKSIYATFQYLLSHAGVSRFHTTTWFGKLSYRIMRYVPKLGRVLEVCPYCKRPLRPLIWIGGTDRGPPELVYSEDPLENCFLGDPLDWGNV